MNIFLKVFGLFVCFSLIAACDSDSKSNDDSIIEKCAPCTIFVTSTNVDGNLGGIAGADSLCMSDPNYPGAGTYKAMLVDGINRVATITQNTGDGQVDWVLQPNTDYVQADGVTPIMTTDNNGLFVFGTLTNSISTTAKIVWTDMLASWISNTTNCSAWTSNSSTVNGTYGDSTSLIGAAVGVETLSCDTATMALYCVQQ